MHREDQNIETSYALSHVEKPGLCRPNSESKTSSIKLQLLGVYAM